MYIYFDSTEMMFYPSIREAIFLSKSLGKEAIYLDIDLEQDLIIQDLLLDYDMKATFINMDTYQGSEIIHKSLSDLMRIIKSEMSFWKEKEPIKGYTKTGRNTSEKDFKKGLKDMLKIKY